MTRRLVLAAAALAVALSSSVTSAPALAAADDFCGGGLPFAGTAAGAVGRDDDADWWYHPVVPGRYLVTMTSGVGDAALVVGEDGCGVICERSGAVGPETCDVEVSGLGLRVGVVSASRRAAGYVVTVSPFADTSPASPAVTACSDGKDNDLDGVTDAPSDPGCEGFQDNSEDNSTCSSVGPSQVCAGLAVGAEREKLTAVVFDKEQYEIAGWLYTYRFKVPGGAGVRVQCVVLIVEPAGTSDTCRSAGGKLVSEDAMLYRVTPDVPKPPPHTGRVVGVCEAVLTLTVDSQGVPGRDVLVPC